MLCFKSLFLNSFLAKHSKQVDENKLEMSSDRLLLSELYACISLTENGKPFVNWDVAYYSLMKASIVVHGLKLLQFIDY